MLRRLGPAVALLSSLLVGACDKPAPAAPPATPIPTERRPLVASAEAPFLTEAEDDEPAADIGRAGEVVEIVKELGSLKWEAGLGDKLGKREGHILEVRQAPTDGVFFGWKSDLGPEVDVPTTAGICDALALDPAIPAAAKRPSCAGMLRRLRMPDGAFAAYHVCGAGPCPVAVLRDGRVRAITVEGMGKARMLVTPGGPMLLAWTRWARNDGTWTGGTLVPVKLSGPAPVALAAIPIDEVDARDSVKVTSRTVQATIEGTDHVSLHLVGARRETVLADARVLASTPIDERIPLGDP